MSKKQNLRKIDLIKSTIINWIKVNILSIICGTEHICRILSLARLLILSIFVWKRPSYSCNLCLHHTYQHQSIEHFPKQICRLTHHQPLFVQVLIQRPFLLLPNICMDKFCNKICDPISFFLSTIYYYMLDKISFYLKVKQKIMFFI